MRAFNGDRGVTLAETMIAVLIALIGVFSLGSVIFQATATSKNQGTEVTRATIYAQDKTEKLLSLNFSDCTQAASTQEAQTGKPCNSTGITASGWTQGLLWGGALSPVQTTCPTSGASVGYVDYLDPNGIQLAGTSCAVVSGAVPAYIREWQIADIVADVTGPPHVAGLKQVTVAVYAQNAIGAVGGKPIVILTSLLSNPN
jgi:hypothetical protein